MVLEKGESRRCKLAGHAHDLHAPQASVSLAPVLVALQYVECKMSPALQIQHHLFLKTSKFRFLFAILQKALFFCLLCQKHTNSTRGSLVFNLPF